MSETEGKSKFIWTWTIWSWICVGIGVAVFFMALTGGAPLWIGIALGAAIAVIGGIAFGFVPRDKPKPGIHGSGTLPPGAARRQRKAEQERRRSGQ